MTMNLFTELGRFAPNRIFIGVSLGGFAGVCYSFLIPLVTSAIAMQTEHPIAVESSTASLFTFEVSQPRFASAFFVLCTVIFAFRLASRLLLAGVAIDLTAMMRDRLSQMIVKAQTYNLEEIGPSRLMAVLTRDTSQIVNAAQLLPAVMMNVVNLIGCLGFLIYLNFALFRIVMFAIAIGVVTYQVPMYFAARLAARVRQSFNHLQEAVRGIIYGAKELKLDRVKRQSYFDNVFNANQRALATLEKQTMSVFIAAETYGDMLGFIVIGLIAFVAANYNSVRPSDLVGVTMAILYVSGPIAFILQVMPQIVAAKTSINNVHQLFGEFTEEQERPFLTVPNWNCIQLSNASFAYRSTGQRDAFAVGPFNFELKKGEITFIVGGNGSGKSTLGKLLALHYSPSTGYISWDDEKVTENTVDSMRQQISAIFSDFYLFDRLLTPTLQSSEKVKEYMKLLGLQNIVTINNGIFSTLSLSDGQRKRLALLVALADNKDIYLFDEWAADQDPNFKEIFYRTILPELRSRNKLVLVISHDDRYFDVADQLIVMEDGIGRATRVRQFEAQISPALQ